MNEKFVGTMNLSRQMQNANPRTHIICHCSLSIPSSKRKFKGYRKIPYGMKLVNGLHSYALPGVLSDPLTKSMIIKVGI